MSLRVLLVQSDMQTTQPLARYFTQRGDEVWQAWELGQAQALIEQSQPNLMMMDLHFASAEWHNFLRRVRLAHPGLKIIMTNKYPDLQREMLAREQNVQVFLRQPFTARWIDQALKRLVEDTQPVRVGTAKTQARRAVEPEQPSLRKVRMPVRVKITLPYLMLAMLFALSGAYIVSRVVVEEIQSRFYNRLAETGRQSADWMVREEDRLLETLRLVANSQGVGDALRAADSEKLRLMALPLATNAGDETLAFVDLNGVSVLSMFHQPGMTPGSYEYTRGDDTFGRWDFVRRVLMSLVDMQGDKFAGVGRLEQGQFFYVCGPVFDSDGELAGAILVGKSLHALVSGMEQETLAETTLYDLTGRPLASTLFSSEETYTLAAGEVSGVLENQEETSPTRELRVSTLDYVEILGPWEVRAGDDLGVLGVSMGQAFLTRTSQSMRWQIFALIASGILFVILVGIYLASLITRPLLRLVRASSEVAQGNLEVKVDARGDDEVAVLAQSFNYMVAGLQEGSIYRDLLGRTVSPEVREQLRQTFTSGNLRLEGQQAVATVLMCDIRGFTSLSENADPATVFQWLNEYFSQIVPVVAARGGVVNKFDGDAMLAFFGILPRPLSPKQSAIAACQTALEMLQIIDRLNALRARRGEPQMITGIGLNTGVVTAGGLGTSDRMHYTIIGDTVNTTQRIEALTRELMDCSGALVSQSTVNALGSSQGRFYLTPRGEHAVKGKSEPLNVYQLLPSGNGRGEDGGEAG